MMSIGIGHRAARGPQRRFCSGLLAIFITLVAGALFTAGFNAGVARAQDLDGLRLRWIRTPDCPPRSCWQVAVRAVSTSCPHGLYLAVNEWTQADLRSPTNVFLGDVATVLPRLRRGETAVVTLPRSARTAEGVSLSEINCY